MGADALSLGVLGVGNIGQVHLGSALAMDGVNVRAVADVDGENRQRARKLGVGTTYRSYEELLATEALDAVVVALPPFLHAPAVEAAADAGCHAFVEKPFARTTDEADRMLAAAESAGVALGVDHTIRYQPEVRRLHEAYEDGAVGHVPHAAITRVNDGPFDPPPAERAPPEWPLDPDRAGGGALLELGVHLFDVLAWFFGDVTVEAAHTDAQREIPVEDSATVLCRTAAGTTATLHCGSYQWEELPDVNFSFRLEGVAGSLDADAYLPDNFYRHAATAAVRNVLRRFRGEAPEVYAPTYYLQAHYRALADFVDAVRHGRDPPVPGATGRRTVALAERAYELAGRERRPEEEVA